MMQLQNFSTPLRSTMIKNSTDVIRELRMLIKAREEAWKTIDRKRSWRPSERAMAKAACSAQIDALQIAIGVFTGMIKLAPEQQKQEEHAS